ncbi:MAG: Inner membrane protein YrbG [Candidatus Erwinia impunctatus]|nr:Inner membrane protein YrbG [Culicoides impunctatus]
MLVATVLFIIGSILLAYGADRLVFSAAILGRRIGIPPFIIGMTVVSIGTSLPEIIVSVSAATHGQINIAVGTALGSNMINMLLIMGGAALLHPLTIRSELIRRELLLMLLVSLLCGVILFDSTLSRYEGGALILTAFAYQLFIIHLARKNGKNQQQDTLTREQLAELPRDDTNQTVAFLWLVMALIILPVSTRMVIDNATVIADFFGISELVIGLTLLAIGTSLPELATVIAGALKGEDDIAIGNLIGSNIYNITIVLGAPGLLHPGAIDLQAFARDYWLMLGVSALFTLLCLQKTRKLGRLTGLLLLLALVAWIALLYWFPSTSLL